MVAEDKQNGVDDAAEICTLRHRQIDRLVSGDLGEAEKCELLAWLEDDPQRWRRCGLAFVEAQTLREAFAALDRDGLRTDAEANGAPVVHLAKDDCRRPRRRQVFVATTLAAAAALLAAFCIGWFSRGPGGANHAATDIGSQPGQIGGSGSDRDHMPQEGNGDAAADLDQAGVAESGDRILPPILGITRLAVGQGSATRHVTVPVFAGSEPDPNWKLPQTALPPYVRSQWERQGYRISQDRRFLPVTTSDGRKGMIPVDQFQFTYVGREPL